MMRLKTVVLGLIVAVFVVGAPAVYAAGFPMAATINTGEDSIIIVGKFNDSMFTSSEVDELATTINVLLGLLSDSEFTVSFFSLDFLRNLGFGDADALRDFILERYVQAGFDLYIFLDITKRPSVQPTLGTGQSIRIDAFVAGFAALFESSEDFLYVASIEAPEFFLALLGSLGDLDISLLVDNVRKQALGLLEQ
ncbi:MAG: hypothetical protein JRI22_13555 [Deltaproteobacteria bacterium]|nr:hypothetical protein [Deltaproteobacteria bacterium]